MQPTAPQPSEEDGLAHHYNAYYYAHSLGEPCHHDSAVWHAFLGGVADAIVGDIQPRTVLDAGCGMGILVEELRRRNVDARGFDISSYAIGQVSEAVRPYCTVASILEPITRDYDLVVCIEVLEHLPPELAGPAVANLVCHTGAVLFSSTPEDFREPTHLNVRPTDFWAGLFARHGFYRDHQFEANVIAPQAMLLRRRRGSIVPIIREYEFHQWRAGLENRELRAAHLAASQEQAQLSAELERVTAERDALLREMATERARAPVVPPHRPRRRWTNPGLGIGRLGARLSRVLAPTASRSADALDEHHTTAHPQFSSVNGEPGPLAASPAAAPAATSPQPQPDGLRCGIEAPPRDSILRALAVLSGYAVDLSATSDTGVREVSVYLDGAFKGMATYGMTRADLGEHFGSSRFTDSGWRYALDLASVDAGPHEVQVRVRSSISGQEATASRAINVQGYFSSNPRQRVALFISATHGDSTRYRCEHAAEQFGMLGVTADSLLYDQVALGEALDEYQLFVFNRVPFGEDIAWFLDQARSRGKRVLFDADDLVFDLDAIRFIAGIEQMSRAQRGNFLDVIARCREALVRCDGVLVSTDPLGKLAHSLNEKVGVVPNAVNEGMIRDAAAARRWRDAHLHVDRDPSLVTIAYLSGTPTHNRDFLEAADAVLSALETYSHVRFLAVGPVTLDDRFLQYADRVERVPLQPWRRLPDLLVGVDINLAPLEPFNPFTDSKSCIKFLEAGLVEVPTIASPRGDFKRVIEHALNGYLADTPEEWWDALRTLVESPDARARVGARARQDVENHHSTSVSAPALLRTIRAWSPAVGPGQRPLAINWLMRSVADDDNPATRMLLELARELAARNHRVRLCLDPSVVSSTGLADIENRGLSTAGLEVWLDPNELPAADVSVATDCATAHRVAADELSLFKLHYAQEFEPASYPRSERLAQEAERAYELPLRLICASTSIAERINQVTRRPVDCLPPGPLQADQFEAMLLEMCFVRLDTH